MRRTLLILAAILILCTSAAVPAAAHSNGFYTTANPSNEWLQIKDNSKYNVWRYCCSGVNGWGWDPLNCRWQFGGDSCPGVDLDVVGIDSGTSSGGTDLIVADWYVPHATWAGTHRRYASSPDYVYINPWYADHKDDNSLASLFNHELGHDLSFLHPPDTAYYWKNSVMVPCSDCHGYAHAKLCCHDPQDYIKAWLYGDPTTP